MEMVEQRHQLMNRLAIAEHKALNAQNQTRYLQSGDKGNIWTTLAFLWNQHRKG